MIDSGKHTHGADRTWRQTAGSAMAVAALMALGSAWAGPPTAQSEAAITTGEAFQACLRAAADVPQPSMPLATATTAGDRCSQEAAALSAAILKENPDRPLFAQSYVKTLQDAVSAPTSAFVKPHSGPSTLLAQRRLP